MTKPQTLVGLILLWENFKNSWLGRLLRDIGEAVKTSAMDPHEVRKRLHGK